MNKTINWESLTERLQPGETRSIFEILRLDDLKDPAMDLLLTTREAAHYLRLTENALRICVHRGQVKVQRIGRRLRFKLRDCRALITEFKVTQP